MSDGKSSPDSNGVSEAGEKFLHVEEARDLFQDESHVWVQIVHSAHLVVNADGWSQRVGERFDQIGSIVVVWKLWRAGGGDREEEGHHDEVTNSSHCSNCSQKDMTARAFCTLFFLLSLYLMRSRMKLRTSFGHKFWTSLSNAIATGIVWNSKK